MNFKKLGLIIVSVVLAFLLVGCEDISSAGSVADTKKTLDIGDKLSSNQETPTDIDYSLERYNLIKRTYWVNGQREKANTLPCAVTRPLGYVVLFTESGSIIGTFTVDGKVSSLNSYLTPDSEYYEIDATGSSMRRDNKWLPDVDGSYGENDSGIFFFTSDGKYIEWTGTYLYSDIPFIVENPVLKVGE